MDNNADNVLTSSQTHHNLSNTTKIKIKENIGNVQGGSYMTGTDLCVNKCKQSRSHLNHLVL